MPLLKRGGFLRDKLLFIALRFLFFVKKIQIFFKNFYIRS